MPTEEQRLTFGGRQLVDSAVLAECGVTDEATLYSLARLLGGGKKRKKKTYTKPKKIKHKHKKIKLRVLKFYKVLAAAASCKTQCEPIAVHIQYQYMVCRCLFMTDQLRVAGRRLGQGAAAAQGLPGAHLRPRHLHGHPLQSRVLRQMRVR